MTIDWTQIKRLKDLALKVNRGRWKNNDLFVWAEWEYDLPGEEPFTNIYEDEPVANAFDKLDAQYIAAADPWIALWLIAEIERLEYEADWLADRLASVSGLYPPSCAFGPRFRGCRSCRRACRLSLWRNDAGKDREGLLYF